MKWPAWTRRALLAYVVLLGVSHVVSWQRRDREPRLDPADRRIELSIVDEGGAREDERDGRKARWVYRDHGPAEGAPVLVLLHGSPGSLFDFERVVDLLDDDFRVLVPDLPGFGKSRQRLPDYSIDAHARYLLAFLDRLDVQRFHVVGFSMGGGVAIRAADLAPERVESVTLLSAIGVQEVELFGNYELNHLVHAFQLGALKAARLLLPHMGTLDDAFFGIGYARNFYDTDQRPLRADLGELESPMLVLHGRDDFLVPVEAALEHHRIVPHSELELFERGHFLLFQQGPEIAARLRDFLVRVESGEALRRADADPERLARAEAPFDATDLPAAGGVMLLLMLVLIALATFVSEDLTCIGVGLLVAEQRIGFVPGTLACLAGIFLGDVGIYLEGRFLGRPALEHAPLRWFVSRARIDRASAWFARHGGKVVFVSRFTPGTRAATYFVAGLSRAHFGLFCLYFLIAAGLWTPILVGFAAWIGAEVVGTFGAFEKHALPALVIAGLVVLFVQRIVVRLATARGRRRLFGTWRRLRHWEFWPSWIVYAPVAPYVGWLALRHGSLRLMTAVNPAIPAGGFVGEPKGAILDALRSGDPGGPGGPGGNGQLVARHRAIRCTDPAEERLRGAREFLAQNGLDYPVILKPDVGQRGSGVFIVADARELDRRLSSLEIDSILQEYVPGEEFGLFYARRPSEPIGRLISITEKRRPFVVGDGQRTLEDLILFDDRAVCLASTYFDLNLEHLDDVPAAGERVEIAQLGTHCRGAIFLDGEHLASPELTEAVDRLSRGFDGFYFGRYDVRTPSRAALVEGRFCVIELNGLTSESTHIYDPRHGIVNAWRTLCRQWKLAFEIARENHARGVPTVPFLTLLRQLAAYRDLQRKHASS